MGMNDMIHFFRQISGKLGSGIYAGVQGKSTPQNISFLRQIQKEMKQKNSLDSPLHELNVVVFDLETTGFYPERGDQIISIGAVKMTGQQIITSETFYSLVKTDLTLSDEITSLTNIRNDDLINAPSAAEVLMQFFQFVGKHDLVAHHAKHEQSFMQKMTWDLLKTRFEHRIIDTSFLIRLSDPTVKSISLEDVCNECGISIKDRHHALGDAMMTAQVWSHYLEKTQRNGFYTLRDVYEYIAK
nr:exonuclease domain-containing protein [Neobacillus sp. Marseille-Q6967]